MITRAQIEATSDELDYMNYRDARDAGEGRQAIVAHWGARRVVELEARYQAELAERKADTAGDELQGSLSRAEAARQ